MLPPICMECLWRCVRHGCDWLKPFVYQSRLCVSLVEDYPSSPTLAVLLHEDGGRTGGGDGK